MLQLPLRSERDPSLGAIPDDDVVMESQVEQLGCVSELAGEAKILAGWGRIPGRVVVDEDQGCCALSKRRTKYLAGVDKRGGLGSERYERVHQVVILGIQQNGPEAFLVVVRSADKIPR